MAAFLDRWLEHVKAQVSPRSHERYAEIAKKNLAPLLGATLLSKLQPSAISSAYAKALISGRHSHATQLLASGIHPKIAQERLGHSSITVTLDLYSHAVESMQDEAATRVDAALGRGLDKQREKKG